MSAEELIQIFYSGGNERRVDLQIILDIQYMLESKLLFHSAHLLAKKEVYYSYIDKLRSGEIKVFDVDGGGIGHMALKCMSIELLEQITSSKCQIENEFAGYRPDIITSDRTVIVECGTVNPQKITAYLKNVSVQKLYIIPYPDEDAGDIYYHTFLPSSEFSEFIEFAEQANLDKLKKIQKKQA